MTERFTRAHFSVRQLYCERWERKLQTFHDVADVAFQDRLILLSTYKCCACQCGEKLKGHLVKSK